MILERKVIRGLKFVKIIFLFLYDEIFFKFFGEFILVLELDVDFRFLMY